jgi:hypothetical protein
MIDIEPELLWSLYWGNEYTLYQISLIFSCGYETIRRKMLTYGIPRRGLTDFKFDNRQHQVFEGCMLGDGGLVWQTNYCYFSNTDIHKEYLFWLQKQLGIEEISMVKPVYREGFVYDYVLATRVIPSLRDEYKRWYPDGAGTLNDIHRKIIPKDIELTITKLLFWYIGDGSYEKKHNAVSFGNSLDFDVWKILLDKVCKVLDVDDGVSINKCGRKDASRQGYFLRLGRTVTSKFFGMVDTLAFDIPKCYQYKFGR